MDHFRSLRDRKSDVCVVSFPIPAAVTIIDLLRKMAAKGGNLSSEADEKHLRLEEKMKLHHLQKMMFRFQNHNPPPIKVVDPAGYAPTKFIEREKGSLNRKEFTITISNILGTQEYNDQLDKLFTVLDVSGDGYVDWHEFCMYMLVQFQENDHLQSKRSVPFVTEPRIKHIVHNRQEISVKVLTMENPIKFLTVSKEGAISVWDPSLRLEQNTFTIQQEEWNAMGQKRRFKTWVTDAVYLSDAHKILLSSTSRDIRIIEASSPNLMEDTLLYSMPDVPCCLTYWCKEQSAIHGESYLFIGMDTGAIHQLTFVNAGMALFEKASGAENKVFWQDLYKHSRWVKHRVLTSLHTGSIKRLIYCAQSSMLISASEDPSTPLVITDVNGTKEGYRFKTSKGLECLDYNRELNLLVTGSSDHVARLWNPYVAHKPIALLHGHSTGVIDVKLDQVRTVVFTYSKDAVLKAWCAKDHTPLQTIILKFPSASSGRMPEHGPFPMCLHVAVRTLAVCCGDYISALKIGQAPETASLYAVTHNAAVSCLVYNPAYKEAYNITLDLYSKFVVTKVVTASDDSSISVWNVETGERLAMYTDTHGSEEITCMSFDNLWRRLITGARNGTLKVWNIRTGHTLQELEPVGEAEVTGIIQLVDAKLIMVAGWNRKLVTYDDSEPDTQHIKGSTSWEGGQLHQDDILAVAHSPPNLVATASFDGELLVWTSETQKLFLRLRKGHVHSVSAKLRQLQCLGPNSRPNSRHRSKHTPVKGEATPVDALLFLHARVRNPSFACLLSSEGGEIRWWNIYSRHPESGVFYAAKEDEESILNFCSDAANTMLLTGDTGGYVSLWDIKDYCVTLSKTPVLEKPPLLAQWKAHDTTIVGVELVEHDRGLFVITGSTDRTVRLWTGSGQFIGTFVQNATWDLSDQSTWAYPETPWSLQARQRLGSPGAGSQTSTSPNQIGASANKESEMLITDSEGNHSFTIRVDDADRPVTAPNSADKDERSKSATRIAETAQQPSLLPKSESLQPTPGSSTEQSLVRSQTEPPFTLESLHQLPTISREKTSLGIRFERDLERSNRDRADRRANYSEIDDKKLYQFSKICSPCQTLHTKDISNTNLSPHLPMSRRMHRYLKDNKIEVITEKTLLNIDFNKIDTGENMNVYTTEDIPVSIS